MSEEAALEAVPRRPKTTIVVVPERWAIQRDAHSWAVCQWGWCSHRKRKCWEQTTWHPSVADAAQYVAERLRDEVPVESLDALVARAREAEVRVCHALAPVAWRALAAWDAPDPSGISAAMEDLRCVLTGWPR